MRILPIVFALAFAALVAPAPMVTHAATHTGEAPVISPAQPQQQQQQVDDNDDTRVEVQVLVLSIAVFEDGLVGPAAPVPPPTLGHGPPRAPAPPAHH
jgi:hypothetical protein